MDVSEFFHATEMSMSLFSKTCFSVSWNKQCGERGIIVQVSPMKLYLLVTRRQCGERGIIVQVSPMKLYLLVTRRQCGERGITVQVSPNLYF